MRSGCGLWCSLDGRRRSEEFEGGIIRVTVVITMVGTTPALIFVLAAAAVAHIAEGNGDVEALPECLLNSCILAAVEEGSRREEELEGAGKNGGWGEGHEQVNPVLTSDLTHVAGHVNGLFARKAAPELFEYGPIRLALSRPRWEVLAI